MLLSLTTLLAQDAPPDHASMHPSSKAAALHLAGKVAIAAEADRPVYKPARCDAQGNIYFRAYQPDDRKVPVVRADGQGKATRYSLDSDPSFATATAYDFSVLPNGELYQPVQLGKDVYVVAFDKQGKTRWKVRLEKQFWVSRLFAFDDRSFLVIGTEAKTQASGQDRDKDKQARTYEPVVAIFDRSGRLIRPVTLSLDVTANEKQDNSQEKAKTAPPLLALLGSDGQTSADGKVYLLVHSDPPILYIVDASGGSVRSLEINAPQSRMSPVSMSLDKERLAILFRHSFQGMSHGEDIISVMDISHGAEVGQFSVPAELGTALACFRSNDFVFIGSGEGSLAIEYSRANSPKP